MTSVPESRRSSVCRTRVISATRRCRRPQRQYTRRNDQLRVTCVLLCPSIAGHLRHIASSRRRLRLAFPPRSAEALRHIPTVQNIMTRRTSRPCLRYPPPCLLSHSIPHLLRRRVSRRTIHISLIRLSVLDLRRPSLPNPLLLSLYRSLTPAHPRCRADYRVQAMHPILRALFRQPRLLPSTAHPRLPLPARARAVTAARHGPTACTSATWSTAFNAWTRSCPL